MNKKIVAVAACVIALAGCKYGPRPAPTPTPSPTTTTAAPAPGGGQSLAPITRSGQTLQLNGAPYQFAGVAADTWFGCWDGEFEATNAANLDKFFSELNPNTVTRIWAYGDTDWEEKLGLIVEKAEQHNQFLMVTLSDHQDDGTQCGSNKGDSYPADGGPVLAHVQDIVPKFADTDAIAIWEIINEGSRDAEDAAWYATIGAEIKRLDPNSLVASGAGTCYDEDWEQCVAVEDFPANDLVSIHEYDDNGGDVSHWTDETQNVANTVGLPWFVGEFGYCCNGGDTGSDSGNAELLATEYRSYLDAEGNAGALYWDFKWGHDSDTTINLGDAMWDTVSSFNG